MSRTRFPQVVVAGIVMVGLLAAFFLLRSKPQTAAPTPATPEAVAAAAPAGRRVDPAPYRPQIQAIEAILYKDSPAEFGDQGKVAGAAQKLGEAVLRAAPASPAGRELMAYAGGADAESDVGYAAPDLSRARARWETTRARAFEPAAWFTGASPGMVLRQTPKAPVTSAQTISALKDAAILMDDLIRQARRELPAFGEIGAGIAEGSPQAKQLKDRWNTWSRGWDSRVNEVAKLFPPRPPLDDLNPTMAYQHMGNAIGQLRGIPVSANDYGVPFVYERENKITTAQAEIAKAREYLAKVEP